MKKRLVFLVSGSGTNMQAVIDGIKKGDINAQAAAVISSNYEAYALTRARNEGIPAYIFAKKDYDDSFEKRDEALLKKLDEIDPDYILLVGYLGILSPNIIDRFENKIINIHPSLLPRHGGKGFHGMRVHQAVIAAKDKISGATVFFVDKGTDTGVIIGQKSVEVEEGETAESLQQKVLHRCEHPLLTEVVKRLCDDGADVRR